MNIDTKSSKRHYNPIKKSTGVNHSEKYLVKLCEKTFLSLWSYPNLFRAYNKELSDLLVVFGDHVLIFSDKTCQYPTTTNHELNWQRWFRRAVIKSAQQLWRAEQWIKEHPSKVFFDKECKEIFPFDINNKNLKIHLVLVARGVSGACKKYFKSGSGSLIIDNEIKGVDLHNNPFHIGDINPLKSFVHVLDDTTLDLLMGALDTTSDLISYLSKKEILLRSNKSILATGEEDLLPSYLTKMKDGEHDFDFPSESDHIAIVEGAWENFCKNPQRVAQIKEDKISYFWDSLIEQFNINALNGTQYVVSVGGIKTSEKILRFFARESRFNRRVLSKAILGLIEKTPDHICGRRFIIPLKETGPYYVLIVFPKKENLSEEEYRQFRGEYLKACCMIVRSKYPNAKDVIGFATESGKNLKGRSEDAIYLDGRHWNDKMQKEAKELQNKLDILINPSMQKVHDMEFPDVPEAKYPKVGRNEKCPCGSDKKYKKCHGY